MAGMTWDEMGWDGLEVMRAEKKTRGSFGPLASQFPGTLFRTRRVLSFAEQLTKGVG